MFAQPTASRPSWLPWLLALAGFWLSCNLVIDFLVMPIMQVSGMTAAPDFASAGYMLFWSFNRIELLCAAAILTGILAVRHRMGEFEVCASGSRCRWALFLGLSLLGITLLDTYGLTPAMGALAIPLDTLNDAPTIAPAMAGFHALYWLAESLKLASLGLLARLCYSDLQPNHAITSPLKVVA